MKFFVDHDVPENVAHLLRYWGHEVTLLREALPITATDDEAFAHARANAMITITCNRDDYLALAARYPEQPGLIILLRRRSRPGETGRLLTLLKNAGEQGLNNNINFA